MLEVHDLSVTVDDKQILHNLSIACPAGTVSACMGPNGAGKSTLVYALLGHPHYHITNGTIMLDGIDITSMTIDERARRGLFVAFQYPQSIPGVVVLDFLKEAYRACVTPDSDLSVIIEQATRAFELVGLNPSFLYRGVHEGFSGGEKKRFEIAQLIFLKPKIAILDEIDSGLDVDAIKQIAQALHTARQENPCLSIVLITHYQRILEHIVPDAVHVIVDGHIVASANAELARRVEARGYEHFTS